MTSAQPAPFSTPGRRESEAEGSKSKTAPPRDPHSASPPSGSDEAVTFTSSELVPAAGFPGCAGGPSRWAEAQSLVDIIPGGEVLAGDLPPVAWADPTHARRAQRRVHRRRWQPQRGC